MKSEELNLNDKQQKNDLNIPNEKNIILIKR